MANITQINGNLIDAATASFTISASYATTAQNVLGSITSASYAATASILLGSVVSASFATTASFALAVAGGGGGAAFPYTGSAVISGSLTVTGSTNINGALSATSITSSGNSFLNGNVLLKGTLANNQGLTIQDRNGVTVVSLPTEASGVIYSGSIHNLSIGGAGSTAKVTIQGNGATNSSLNTLFRNSNLTTILSMYDGGNIGVGDITPVFPLDVGVITRFQSGITGSLSVTGSLTSTSIISASSFNYGLSSLTQSRVLLDNTFDNTAISAANPNSIRDRSPLLRVYGTYTTASANTAYNNQIISAHLYPTFNPVNNTLAVFNTLVLEPQFSNANATGSARGLYITPGIAFNHPNWRSIEWDNSTSIGWGLYGSGDAPNYLNGNLGIKTTIPSASLHVVGNAIVTQGITGSLLGTASFAISASWAPNTGGTPGGTVNEVQYNNGAGGFAGAANVEISTGGNITLVATTDPATPSAGTLEMYAKTIAGRTLPKVKGPSGLDYVLQPALFQNANYLWTTTGATAGLWLNTAGQGNGTFAATNPTTSGGTLYTVQKRSRYSNVVTTANQILGQRNTDAIFFRGAATGQGGFFFYTRCGFDTWTNGGRFFAGMATATTVISADPSALNNTVGFCVDAADNGAISFLTRGTAATKASTGLTITTGKGYDIFIFNAPNSGTFGWRIVDLITGTEASGTATLNPPAAGTALTANVLASNAAVNPANSIQLGISKIYIETDY